MIFFKPEIKRLTEMKNVPGLIKSAESGLKYKDIKIGLNAITNLGDISDSREVNPLIQMVEETHP